MKLSQVKIKDRYRTASRVSVDYFIFSCQQLESSQQDESKGWIPEYPLDFTGQEENETKPEIKVALSSLLAWYTQKHPSLLSRAAFNYTYLGSNIYIYLGLIRDIQKLVESHFEYIPSRKKQVGSSASLAEPWPIVDAAVLDCLPRATYVLAYLDWCHCGFESFCEEPDYRLVAPVGRYFYKVRKALGDLYKEFADPEPVRSAAGSGDDRRYSRYNNRGYDRNNFDRKGSDRRGFEKKSFDKRPSVETKNDERLAIQDVVQAIKKLESNPSLKVLTLKTQNSFIRRQQHSKVSQLGFISHSVGDIDNRSIQIKRT
jgi:hypothetical protein